MERAAVAGARRTSGRVRVTSARLIGIGAAVASLTGCTRREAPELRAEVMTVPVSDSVLVPQLTAIGHDSALLAWYRPRPTGGYTFHFAQWSAGRWSASRVVVSDDSVFMHPTDLPSITLLRSGALGAVWQRRVNKATSGDGWQYEFRVQFSSDGGSSWSTPVIPHTGSTRGGEHEFHAAWPTADGRLGMVWIDPRDQTVVPGKDATAEAQFLGAMQMVATTVDPGGSVAPEAIVDDVMCECCPNAVTMTPAGPLVAYRDKRVPAGVARDSLRYEMNVLRDLSLARLVPADSSAPAHWVSGERVTNDNWIYNGCPNNGPSLASAGNRVALAWWTGEGDRPRVQVRWSADGGRSFGPPQIVSEGRADGQVSVALAGDGTVVAWLQGNQVLARHYDARGTPGRTLTVGAAGSRHRLPTMVPLSDGSVVLGYLAPNGHVQLRRLRA